MIQLARTGVQAFSGGASNVLSFRAHLAPDALYEEIRTGQRIQGVDQILAYVLDWKKASPDGMGESRTLWPAGTLPSSKSRGRAL